uniref:Uncharacterized protein n=1 Tax=Romanomermis culicivorax TaxID=13658 RepID=A0A915JDS3_ROMCU
MIDNSMQTVPGEQYYNMASNFKASISESLTISTALTIFYGVVPCAFWVYGVLSYHLNYNSNNLPKIVIFFYVALRRVLEILVLARIWQIKCYTLLSLIVYFLFMCNRSFAARKTSDSLSNRSDGVNDGDESYEDENDDETYEEKRALPGVLRFGKKAMPGVMRFGKRWSGGAGAALSPYDGDDDDEAFYNAYKQRWASRIRKAMPGVMRFGKRSAVKRAGGAIAIGGKHSMPRVMRFG